MEKESIMSASFNEPANSIQAQTKSIIEEYVKKKFEDENIFKFDPLPIYQHTHLQLNSPDSFSTSYEGLYLGGDLMMEVVSNAIAEGDIQLPDGYWFEMYSGVEMYFYKS